VLTLDSMQGLEQLRLHAINAARYLQGAVLAAVCRLRHLHTLALYSQYVILPAHLTTPVVNVGTLGQLPHLTAFTLEISSYPAESGSSLAQQLGELKQLRKLRLRNAGIAEAVLLTSIATAQLDTLQLDYCSDGLTASLVGWTHLRFLRLCNFFHKVDFKPLVACPGLEQLLLQTHSSDVTLPLSRPSMRQLRLIEPQVQQLLQDLPLLHVVIFMPPITAYKRTPHVSRKNKHQYWHAVSEFNAMERCRVVFQLPRHFDF
jgi:hypothetical protein